MHRTRHAFLPGHAITAYSGRTWHTLFSCVPTCPGGACRFCRHPIAASLIAANTIAVVAGRSRRRVSAAPVSARDSQLPPEASLLRIVGVSRRTLRERDLLAPGEKIQTVTALNETDLQVAGLSTDPYQRVSPGPQLA